MRIVKRFPRLSMREWILFLHSFFLIFAVRIGLSVLPFRWLRQLMASADDQITGQIYPVERIVWAVKAASRYVPRATCLTQALVADRLLARSGHRPSLKIGVAKDDQLRFHAHAWVLCGTQVVIGGPEVEHYVPLLTWKEGR
jgi:hypothetical protein